jgi:hypothetical protein
LLGEQFLTPPGTLREGSGNDRPDLFLRQSASAAPHRNLRWNQEAGRGRQTRFAEALLHLLAGKQAQAAGLRRPAQQDLDRDLAQVGRSRRRKQVRKPDHFLVHFGRFN